jgi:hypothetical protein
VSKSNHRSVELKNVFLRAANTNVEIKGCIRIVKKIKRKPGCACAVYKFVNIISRQPVGISRVPKPPLGAVALSTAEDERSVGFQRSATLRHIIGRGNENDTCRNRCDNEKKRQELCYLLHNHISYPPKPLFLERIDPSHDIDSIPYYTKIVNLKKHFLFFEQTTGGRFCAACTIPLDMGGIRQVLGEKTARGSLRERELGRFVLFSRSAALYSLIIV